MSYETEIQIYKGKNILSNIIYKKKPPNVIAFDLDETLGSFSDLETLWSAIQSFYPNNQINIDFNHLLDLYPEFLRYGILQILEYLYQKKKKGICDKVYIYTNNQCSPEWCKMIAKYFDYKLEITTSDVKTKLLVRSDSEYSINTENIIKTDTIFFDKIICAFKVNNKIIEMGRTTHNKTYNDFIKCTILSKKTILCFVDNTYFNEMNNDNVYYIQPKSYIHHLSTETILDRFLGSDLCKNSLSDTEHYLFSDYLYMQFFKKGFFNNVRISKKILEMDILVAQKMMYHIKEFFYILQKKGRTKKIKYPIGRFTKKKHI
jgi:hypothetical protein